MTDQSENQAQARVRMGRDLQSLEPQTRLDWAHAGAIPDEVVEPDPIPETYEQKRYLGGRTRDQLASALDIENYEWLGSEAFRKTSESEREPAEASDSNPPPAPLPARPIGPGSALDPAKVEGLRPELRVELDNRLQRAKKGLAGYSTLSDRQEMADAELYLRPYLK
ncbi:hypothetical protein LHFGNBLO_001368 [Mesorhizobium sp. AR10]|uniref:hypothetical protein n=1 Tax=Mesorhizobium sp. AR10 TaxID=2865839 RepID=UPI00215FF7E5|nr:hypothetical protein [Mesorhizobium sp. AR10]UVK39953.1 hypothetical protein LHFGNBLO_001368 [Mesorhizobium sp. AR10]